jgi:small subunit ribosomal protein S9
LIDDATSEPPEAPDTPAADAPEAPDTPAGAEAPEAPGAPEAAETPEAPGTPQAPVPPAPAKPAAEHAVPSEEAKEIAGAVEDVPLEALQESEDQPGPEDKDKPGPEDKPPPAGERTQREEEPEDEPKPREKPAVPGAHLEVDIVPEGVDPLGRDREPEDQYTAVAEVYEREVVEEEPAAEAEQPPQDETLSEPISSAAIDLASGARYRATGKRKTAIARVTLRPGDGSYLVNGRALEEHFPRVTLQRNIRQPLETVGYQERMDVIARLHGGGISAQAGALRHGVSRALLEADPNLRGELKRRGFLTRDSRAKERKKAGLKKARKRPQFSKR